ncbi:glycosyltransferase family 4 protein [Thiomicrorhabdus sediminis]|uniref:Glycosyltransferase family 4 protein n=1 Tax=Thiomicrorhabdus sediminis TaxID=2580412 RepID=A0A4P9K3W7_9GAMM|nr:glycosyltransferase family 4 protein [Thiomicrorhabdus sediminis]QCU89568.1 glycosyltransferase family 4 protein [Thiomicrorhabdus sediminis]
MASICIVVAVPSTINAFLINHILYLSKNFDVTIVGNSIEEQLVGIPDNVKLQSIAIQRDIAILSDLKALFALFKFLRKKRFDLVLSVTPKAGLLGSLASCFCRVPIRLHWFTGQVWVTQKGFKRTLLKTLDKLIAACTTHQLVDSQSQLNFLESECVVKPGKAITLGDGSISGVNISRFVFNTEQRKALREKLSIGPKDKVILFLGRLNRDKGVYDLISAFKSLDKLVNIHLVLVGPDEGNIESSVDFSRNKNLKVHFVGHTSTPESWLSVADVFCLPSYREGFGSSVIEAASVGLPSVVSRIYGLTDAVEENVTGLMHEAGDVDDLRTKLEVLLLNDDLRIELGRNALLRVQNNFSQDRISGLFLDYVNSLFLAYK